MILGDMGCLPHWWKEITNGDHTPARAATHSNGLPGQFGSFAHFHGRVKTVHVEVNDLAHTGA